MRWRDSRESGNVQDYRRVRFGGGAGLGIGGTLVALAAAYFFGVDPRVILGLTDAVSNNTQSGEPVTGIPQDEQGRFMSAVLGETEDTWSAIFQVSGREYTPPTLALYSGQIRSACGFASAAAGPFYCPGDQKVYIDLAFFDELKSRFQAPGDFAQAYVLAHEVGHHVQKLLGTEARIRISQENASEHDANALQVKMELQADCFAGVWAHNADRARHILEQGDVEEALAAAAAVGDDTLQKRTQGYIVPDSFTHGSAAQRTSWFKRGLTEGTVESCDTFREGA